MNIDRLAIWYRWIEYAAFGRALERRRFAFLHLLSGANRVLILGEGDGRALRRLLVLAPHAQIDVVELSGKMIALARQRAATSNRVNFMQQDAMTATWPQDRYDGVIAFFFLDCFTEADATYLIGQLVGAMVPGAIWLMSDFAIPEQGWRHWHAKAWIWAMYRFFAMATGLRTRNLPPLAKLLEEAGMRRLAFDEERAGLMRSEVWEQSTTSTTKSCARKWRVI